ncbi:MAG: glycoside hydrolase family 2 TIM barrel-domain containing protein, partial [Chitinophagaceae bacterium]
FHLAGGILRTATWWIFLIGFIYTIFKIEVPYIPTPKEDEHKNYIALSIPNILILITSTLFILYGLSIDWTPYSIAMASYSMLTAAMLGFTVMMSQQKVLLSFNNACKKVPTVYASLNFGVFLFNKSQQAAYNFLKSGALVLLLSLSLVFLSYSSLDENTITGISSSKELGGFYLGIEIPEETTVINKVKLTEQSLEHSFNVISFKQNWQMGNDQPFSLELMNDIRDHGALPYIEWRPDSAYTNDLWLKIQSGEYENYLKKCAAFFRNYRDPVFISFQNSGTTSDGASKEDFIKSWQYLYTFFNHMGISNLTWVWCPEDAKHQDYFPGDKFTDWIGVNCLNYGQSKNSKDWYSFTDIYVPYRTNLGYLKKPFMITNFGSIEGQGQQSWLTEAIQDIESKYPEIRSLILFNNINKFEIKTDTGTVIYEADFAFDNSANSHIVQQLKSETFNVCLFKRSLNSFERPDYGYKSRFVKGEPGKFELQINNKSYYIKGVAYNTAHDWRDGNMPLTRRRVVKDFEKIKEMGANTIRRYGTGIYDKNILNIADESGLNVLYGFWFDPKVDYYLDSAKIKAYIKEVEESVVQYKDHPCIIGWSLGNESWGLLKHRYAKPYLVKVRESYVQLIEHLAQRIHELDPSRPVFTCMEHEEHQLPGELAVFHDDAPSVDVIGINSYYKEQISTLNHIAWQFDSLRPYLVSEFGPRGYWDPNYNKTNNKDIIEETDTEKAEWYKYQWSAYVEGFKGYNVGGFAYCWHDRMEGSYTWFGLTDFKGRVKPSYYALKEQWTRKKQEKFSEFSITGPSHLEPGSRYTFSAVSTKGEKDNLLYEWRLLKDEYLKQINNIEATDDPSSVKVEIPKEPSKYRLYLFVTDKDNNRVTTSSSPILVSQNQPQ